MRVSSGCFCAVLPLETGDGLNLYDCTVNDINDPSIFVCYHDAQAYPDYMVHFTQN